MHGVQANETPWGATWALEGVEAMEERVQLLEGIQQSARCTFASIIQVFTHLGIKKERYAFLHMLADLEYKFYMSNYMMEILFFHALAAILEPEKK